MQSVPPALPEQDVRSCSSALLASPAAWLAATSGGPGPRFSIRLDEQESMPQNGQIQV